MQPVATNQHNKDNGIGASSIGSLLWHGLMPTQHDLDDVLDHCQKRPEECINADVVNDL